MTETEAKRIGSRKTLLTIGIIFLLSQVFVWLVSDESFSASALWSINSSYSAAFIIGTILLFSLGYIFGQKAGMQILLYKKNYLCVSLKFGFLALFIVVSILSFTLLYRNDILGEKLAKSLISSLLVISYGSFPTAFISLLIGIQIRNKLPAEFLKPFPEYDEVFKVDSFENRLVFVPLCSVNLKAADKFLDGWVHFIDVWDNGNYEDDSFFNNYRGMLWIKFKVVKNKYSYLGDITAFPRYSELSSWYQQSTKEYDTIKADYIKPHTNGDKSQWMKFKKGEDFDKHLYIERQISYGITKQNYFATNKFMDHRYYTRGNSYEENNLVDKIGGEPEWWQDDETPLNSKGKPLTFIGQLTGFNYLAHGADSIYLFYDNKSKEVTQVFQYT